LLAAQKIWTLKRQDQFSQGIQGPPELPPGSPPRARDRGKA
jgi:hypothetical protein